MRTDDIVKVIAAEEHTRLERRDRRVIAAGELSELHVVALRAAKVPDQYADLDRELQDNTP